MQQDFSKQLANREMEEKNKIAMSRIETMNKQIEQLKNELVKVVKEKNELSLVAQKVEVLAEYKQKYYEL